MKNAVSVLIICAVFVFPALSQKEGNSVCPPVTVSVSRFEAINTGPDLARSLKEHIESSLLNFPGIVVYTGSLSPRFRTFPESDKSSDQYKALNGTISKVGNTYNVVMKLTDLSTGALERSVSRGHDGQAEGLFSAVDTALFIMLHTYISSDCATVSPDISEKEQVSDKSIPKEVKEVETEDTLQKVSDEKESSFLAEQIGVGALAIFVSLTLIFLYSK